MLPYILDVGGPKSADASSLIITTAEAPKVAALLAYCVILLTDLIYTMRGQSLLFHVSYIPGMYLYILLEISNQLNQKL